MKDTILYIGNFEFPNGNAPGKRVYGNARLIKQIGYNVVCLGFSKTIKKISIEDSKSTYEGIDYYSLPYSNDINRMRYRTIFGKIKKFLEEDKLKEKLFAVIIYGSVSNALGALAIIKWCRKNNILIISDCVDWLKASMSNPIIAIIKQIDIDLLVRYVNKKADGVIVISTFLEQYYKRSKTILIPPLIKKSTTVCMQNWNNQRELKIVYAGSPFRSGIRKLSPSMYKDRIDLCVLYICKGIEAGATIHFDIYGLTKEDFLFTVGNDGIKELLVRYSNYIEFHGYTDNELVEDSIVNADFTMLLRDNKKLTKAGFSTKIAESISLNTPVIINNCGDNELYIKDNYNGIILDIDNEEYSVNKLVNISKNIGAIALMKQNCIKDSQFMCETYEKCMREFLLSLE